MLHTQKGKQVSRTTPESENKSWREESHVSALGAGKCSQQ